MGGSWSNSARRNSRHRNPPSPSPPPCYYPPPPPPPPPPAAYYYPPPPPPVQNYGYFTAQYTRQAPLALNTNFPGWYSYDPATTSMGGTRYPINYYGGQSNNWGAQMRAPAVPSPPPHLNMSAKKIKNDVNVHKDSIRLEIDEFNPAQYLTSFIFDALFDGSITIYYFAKEEDNCKLNPVRPEVYTPVRVPFQKGLGQKFRQPSGTGIDLGFFTLDELAKPSSNDDVYPLVISAEVCPISHQKDNEDAYAGHSSPNSQITQAVVERNNGGSFQVKVMKQILWIDRVRYELRELYGITNSSRQEFTDDDSGKECVICMTEPKDTAVMPCRHMCMCSGCAKELRLRSSKCPICRQTITELIEIKLNHNDL